jgi:hypothetical protein
LLFQGGKVSSLLVNRTILDLLVLVPQLSSLSALVPSAAPALAPPTLHARAEDKPQPVCQQPDRHKEFYCHFDKVRILLNTNTFVRSDSTSSFSSSGHIILFCCICLSSFIFLFVCSRSSSNFFNRSWCRKIIILFCCIRLSSFIFLFVCVLDRAQTFSIDHGVGR